MTNIKKELEQKLDHVLADLEQLEFQYRLETSKLYILQKMKESVGKFWKLKYSTGAYSLIGLALLSTTLTGNGTYWLVGLFTGLTLTSYYQYEKKKHEYRNFTAQILYQQEDEGIKEPKKITMGQIGNLLQQIDQHLANTESNHYHMEEKIIRMNQKKEEIQKILYAYMMSDIHSNKDSNQNSEFLKMVTTMPGEMEKPYVKVNQLG